MNPDSEPVERDNQKVWAILSGVAAALAVGGVLWLMGSQRPEVSAAQAARNAPIPGDRIPQRSYTIDLDQEAAGPSEQAPEVEIETVRDSGAKQKAPAPVPQAHGLPQPSGPPALAANVPGVALEPPAEPAVSDKPMPVAPDARPALEPNPAPPAPIARIEAPRAELRSEVGATRPAAQPARHEPDRTPKRVAERPRPATGTRSAGISTDRAMADWHRRFLDDP